VNNLPKVVPGSVSMQSRTCASELSQDYKSDTLPLDHRATLQRCAEMGKITSTARKIPPNINNKYDAMLYVIPADWLSLCTFV